MKKSKALTLTYLTPVSLASLNGSDKETDNISSIKKIKVGKEEYPYVSAQAVRRALRTQLGVMGLQLSEGKTSDTKKGANTTEQDPEKYIDDDLFGYMSTTKADKKTNKKGESIKRTSVIRVSPLIALNPYQGDLDFGTNYMGENENGNPNIYETEIHSGLYRGSILIELDRVGLEEKPPKAFSLTPVDKAKRVKFLLRAIKNLWTIGRQSRYLTDVSPKFVVAAMMSTKNPIFLESVTVSDKKINTDLIQETLKDYQKEIITSTIGIRHGLFEGKIENTKSIGDAFDEMEKWIDQYYT